jgi:FMN reductase
MSSILLISGSPSTTSRSGAVLEYARRHLESQGVEVRLVSVRDFPAEDLLHARYDSPAFDELKGLVERAGAVVVATPIYKAAYSGGLKALLDILPQYAFRSKKILPLATGGSHSHLLAIDYALKPVLAALGASDIHQGVYIVEKQVTIGVDGSAVFADDVQERFDAALADLKGSLV